MAGPRPSGLGVRSVSASPSSLVIEASRVISGTIAPGLHLVSVSVSRARTLSTKPIPASTTTPINSAASSTRNESLGGNSKYVTISTDATLDTSPGPNPPGPGTHHDNRTGT